MDKQIDNKKNEVCPYPELGVYDDMVVVPTPKHMTEKYGGFYKAKKTIAIDPCILKEIELLWSKGVHTYCSCCGHNINEASVVVDKRSKDTMRTLGYKKIENGMNGDIVYALKTGCKVQKGSNTYL